MIRVLLMIAAAGFVLCIACFAGAFAIGGHDLIARGGWTLLSDEGFGDRGWREAETTRQLAWTGGDALIIDLPADVRYVQTDGPPSMTATGPASAIEDLVIENGRITLPGHHRYRDLEIVLRAPSVRQFEVRASGDLAIEGYRQETLSLAMPGSGDVSVSGQATSATVDVSGSGDADLSGLTLGRAKVTVSGSGDVSIAPRDAADLKLSASGDVELLTRPAQMTTDTSASGRVRQRMEGDDGPKPRGKSI